MHLIRQLVFYAALFDFWFRAEHIPGKSNSLADALSRDNINYFLLQAPHFHPQPLSVPPSLLLLVALDEEWTSIPWMELFRRTLQLA